MDDRVGAAARRLETRFMPSVEAGSISSALYQRFCCKKSEIYVRLRERVGFYRAVALHGHRPLSTFGHFATRTANTGERGESKSTGHGACVLPAAAQLPGPFAAKCPKVAITFALDGEVSVSLGAPVLVRAAPQREVRPHTLRLDTLVRGRGKRIEKLLAISLAHEPRIRQNEHAHVA